MLQLISEEFSVRGEISGKVGDYKLKDFNNDSYPDKYNAGLLYRSLMVVG